MRKIIPASFIFLVFLFPFVLISCAGFSTPVIVDSDKDGVPDNYDNRHKFTTPQYYDKCPTTTPPGVKVDNYGCPLDADDDGVPDYLDKCPDTPSGVKVDKDGCPPPPTSTPPPPPVAQTSKTLFVLLPDPDGKIGQVEVRTSDGSQVLGKAFESTEVSSSDKIPGSPKVMDEKAVRDMFKDALDAQPVTPASFIIYFDSGKTTPTKKSMQLIPEIMEAIRARKSNSVVVAGHTDTVGSVEYNQKLSELRAKSVAGALVAKDVDKAIIAVEYYGEDRLLVETPDNVADPGNRRVEIIVR